MQVFGLGRLASLLLANSRIGPRFPRRAVASVVADLAAAPDEDHVRWTGLL
jgi:hypothetical protein